MPEQAGMKTLEVEVTWNVKESFRYYVGSVKRKLAAALIVYALVTTGFVWFFRRIDELPTLLELSPLFFGFPAIAIAGQFLRAHASLRKYYGDLARGDNTVKFVFTDEATVYAVRRGHSSGHRAWCDIRKSSETRSFFTLYRNEYEADIIPKKALKGPDEEDHLRRILRAALGDRAKLEGHGS
jgi:hypothetical protein